MTRLLCLLLALVFTPPALASGGHYTFSGGSSFDVRRYGQALRVSAFNWSLLEQVVTVRIAPGLASGAIPGRITPDAPTRQRRIFVACRAARVRASGGLLPARRCGARAVCREARGPDVVSGRGRLPHGAYGCERFASTLAWAYWPSAQMRPMSPGDESAAMKPARFRALLGDGRQVKIWAMVVK